MRRFATSLHGTLVGASLGFATLAAAVMVGNVLLTSATANTLASIAVTTSQEDEIADRLVENARAQQLEALRYLQTPRAEILQAFHDRGREAFLSVREYLVHPMPLAARLQVERIKEAHERFEVAAQRAFDLSARGEFAASRSQGVEMVALGVELGAVVRQFVRDRHTQHAAARRRGDAVIQRLQRATILLALVFIGVAVVLAHILRRVVLHPLSDLENAAAQLGAGKTGARVSSQRFREFAIVATSFNRMAETVEQSRLVIEQKNRELTLALDDLRRTQQELVQREKLSSMGEMLAGLAHELNNPLAAVLSSAELLHVELGELKDPSAKRLDDELALPLIKSSIRAADLVRNLLKFSRQSEGSLGPVDLAQAVHVAVGLRAHAFRQASKSLVATIPDGMCVVGDAQRLQHVVLNIVNNSLDALIENGGRTATVTARQAGPDCVELVFEDDGRGFADASRAFEPFYTTKPHGTGTGLGLAIVHRFVEECGGSVRAENRVEGGARVVVRLRGTAAMPIPVAVPAVTAAIAVAPRRRRILIVEDEIQLRSLQERMLKRLDVDVTLADSGVEARTLLQTRSFDLVISDLRMPGEMNGLDLLRWLQDAQPELAASALIVTGDLHSVALQELHVGVDRVIRKPFAHADYIQRVQRALNDVPSVLATRVD